MEEVRLRVGRITSRLMAPLFAKPLNAHNEA